MLLGIALELGLQVLQLTSPGVLWPGEWGELKGNPAPGVDREVTPPRVELETKIEVVRDPCRFDACEWDPSPGLIELVARPQEGTEERLRMLVEYSITCTKPWVSALAPHKPVF